MATASARPRPMIMVVRTAFSASGLRPMASSADRTPMPMASAGPTPPNAIAIAAAIRRTASSSNPAKLMNIRLPLVCVLSPDRVRGPMVVMPVPRRNVGRNRREYQCQDGEDGCLDEAEEQLGKHEQHGNHRKAHDGEQHLPTEDV